MSLGPPGAGRIRALLSSHGIEPAKALGQNFVIDPNTVERVARLARLAPGDRVIEIGAGCGSLTEALVATGAEVTAVEIDHRLVAILRETLPASVRILQGDALRTDWAALLGPVEVGRPWVLVANLPYNVATPLVVELLAAVPPILRMVVMVQREAGERFAAYPGSKAYGAVSVRVAYFASAQLLGSVPATVFYPRPRVESVLVGIERREPPRVGGAVVDYAELDLLLRTAFAGRRKMLRRSLAGLVSGEEFAAAGIDPQARPEELGLEAWGTLARCRSTASSPPRS